jgi:hypothetical protein
MSDWSDLVTCALLGTDRRPPPTDLPPSWAGSLEQHDPAAQPASLVLSLAARHRAFARAGAVLPRADAPPGVAADQGPPAPDAAQSLLARLIEASVPELVNLWLAAATDSGQTAASDHWTALAALATKSARVDRPLLAVAIGPRGVWFVAQNPQWSRLSESLGRPSPAAPAPADQPVTVADVLADPAAIFASTAPWPAELTKAALEVIGSGQLHSRGPGYAARLGATMPWAHLHLRQPVADRYLDPDRPAPAVVFRLVRAAFAALDEALALRAEIANVFALESSAALTVAPVDLPPAGPNEWTRPWPR